MFGVCLSISALKIRVDVPLPHGLLSEWCCVMLCIPYLSHSLILLCVWFSAIKLYVALRIHHYERCLHLSLYKSSFRHVSDPLKVVCHYTTINSSGTDATNFPIHLQAFSLVDYQHNRTPSMLVYQRNIWHSVDANIIAITLHSACNQCALSLQWILEISNL